MSSVEQSFEKGPSLAPEEKNWTKAVVQQQQQELQRLKEAQGSAATQPNALCDGQKLDMTPLKELTKAGAINSVHPDGQEKKDPTDLPIGNKIGPTVKGIQPEPLHTPYSGGAQNDVTGRSFEHGTPNESLVTPSEQAAGRVHPNVILPHTPKS